MASNNFLSALSQTLRESVIEPLNNPEFHVSAMLIALLLIFIVMLTLRRFGKDYRYGSNVTKKELDKILQNFYEIEVMIKNDIQTAASTVALRERRYIKEELEKLTESIKATPEEAADLSRQAEEHRLKIEEGLERIAELAKQNKEQSAVTLEERLNTHAEQNRQAAADTATNSDESAKKLHALLEQQSLYLHDSFADLNTQNAAGGATAATMAEKLAQIKDQLRELQQRPQPAATDNTALLEMLSQSMHRLSGEVDAKLTLLNGKLEKNMETSWSGAVDSINNLRAKIEEMSDTSKQIKNITDDVTSLSRLLLARAGMDGESGRQQLAELLPQMLPTEYYQLDCKLNDGYCASALVRFPDPKDSVAIDATLSLKTFVQSLDEQITPAERTQQRELFEQELIGHISHVAEHLIAPPHTGASALMFIPSEAAFSEIHAHHRHALNHALSHRVWLVSPTTLLAVLNTANTALKDHQARGQLQQLQDAVVQIAEEARNFENRLTEIGDHVNSAWRSVQRAENASGRLMGSIRNISDTRIPPPTDDNTA